MDQECLSVVIFDQGSLGARRFRIRKRTLYLLGFFLFCLMFAFCDYIQIRKSILGLNQLRREEQLQNSQIKFFTSRVDGLEKQIAKLMDFNKRIRMIANLERNQEMVSFMGIGGVSPTDIREVLKTQYLAETSAPLILRTNSDPRRP